ncbi:MAG TPA: fumarylacetoacetate hydrolase family protein [Polyangiaceae bacterium]|jgi:2-dehydro-3-deoxy-D-arabinonate dehydratase|nr:fumarylacetoacetate hydrolase family protein [Polyangiaceae bacterium]
MRLTRHSTAHGARWARDGEFLAEGFRLGVLLELAPPFMSPFLDSIATREPALGPLLAPIEDDQEVWASGVTYKRSREARTQESTVKDVYERVYEASRPELFFKAIGRRVVGHGMQIRIRRDSQWNVPEPELTLVLNRSLEVVGYTAGDDVSSRDIEGDNPLYLPQAKVYDGSCALGPALHLCTENALHDVPIRLTILRGGQNAFEGETRSSVMKRSLGELAGYLGRELSFPQGAFLMTGTGIVPPDGFSLVPKDVVRIEVADAVLENDVAENEPSVAARSH